MYACEEPVPGSTLVWFGVHSIDVCHALKDRLTHLVHSHATYSCHSHSTNQSHNFLDSLQKYDMPDIPARLVNSQGQVSRVPMLLRCQRREPAGSEPALTALPGTNNAPAVLLGENGGLAHSGAGLYTQTIKQRLNTALSRAGGDWPCSAFGAFLASFGRRAKPAEPPAIGCLKRCVFTLALASQCRRR